MAKVSPADIAAVKPLTLSLVVVNNSTDFVGLHIGQSEARTRAILASTIGKVLVIDEAYGLAGNSSLQQRGPDRYRRAVIYTLVAEVQGGPGEDRCILLLGYKDQMEGMFRSVNPGLACRFPMSSAFEFEDYTEAQLSEIIDLELVDKGFR